MPDAPNPEQRRPESHFGETLPASVEKLIRQQLNLERKYMEVLVRGLHGAINSKIGFLDHRMMSKFEEVDASLNLIARELARRADDPPPKPEDEGR